MNPETNRFEVLHDEEKIKQLEQAYDQFAGKLFRPDGKEVPKHWSIFQVNEKYVINNYTFECKYIGETAILFEPLGPVVLNEEKPIDASKEG